ncbi:MAG TPA: biotin/lipoyl-binding protein [Crocinitomicaceae bacterium]|nr:biotin/lipoyl-binding protein [Crocinitomicaceae bacterium]
MANRVWNFDGEKVIGNDGAVVKWEDETFFTLSYNGQTFSGEVLEENTESNFLKLKVNHRVFEIRKKGELDDLIAELGLDIPKIRKLKELEAPIPGRIVNIAVTIGQELNVGDDILSLEAMKMENVLKAEGVGVVKTINIKSNDVVEKGEVLIEFE